jgi:hypothetical protein
MTGTFNSAGQRRVQLKVIMKWNPKSRFAPKALQGLNGRGPAGMNGPGDTQASLEPASIEISMKLVCVEPELCLLRGSGTRRPVTHRDPLEGN